MRFLLAFTSGALIDFWLAAHTYAIAHALIVLAAVINLLFPFISLVSTVLVVEEKTLAGKLKLAAATGAGYAVGSTVFIVLSPKMAGI